MPVDGPPPPAPPRSGATSQPGTVCASCGKHNPPGMSFCRNCGKSLGVARSSSGSGSQQRMPSAADVVGRRTPGGSVAATSKVRCVHCGGETPAGYRFCQQCGRPLAASDQEIAQAATDPAEPNKRPPPSVATRPPGVRNTMPASDSGNVMVPDAVAETLAASGESAVDLVKRAEDLAQRRTIEEDPAVSSTLPETPMSEIGHTPRSQAAVSASGRAAVAPWGRLVTVQQDGSDGPAHALAFDTVEIGRDGAGLRFEHDQYMAPAHARLERGDGAVALVPIDRVNGVYRRLRGPVALRHGDYLLLGRELMRFELVTAEERDVKPLVQGGVARFGSPSREPWARLCLVLPNLGVRDVRYISGDELVIGREDGHIVFNDDEFLSRRHAILRWDGRACTLEDLQSSNGTYLRLRGRTELVSRDYLRLGNQLFRFEES